MTQLVKLAAMDADDVAVLSAHVQDAVAKLGDVRWRPSERRFLVEMNRFAWEAGGRERQRRRAVLHFDHVTRVRALGATSAQRDEVVSILAVVFEPTEAPAGVVTVVCSGDVAFRLDVECIEVRLTDLGAAWAASMRPRHALP